MSFMLQPSCRILAQELLATSLIVQKYANMPQNSLRGRPTDEFTKDEWDAYAGNGGLMGKFGFKINKKPKNKPDPAIAPQNRGRGRPQKRQPNQNNVPSLTTARPSLASVKPPPIDVHPPSADTQLESIATQPHSTAVELTSTPRSEIPTSKTAADNPPFT